MRVKGVYLKEKTSKKNQQWTVATPMRNFLLVDLQRPKDKINIFSLENHQTRENVLINIVYCIVWKSESCVVV